MAWFEPLLIIGAVSFVGLVIFLHFYLRKKGKSLGGDCGCNCSKDCANCGQQCLNSKKILQEYKTKYSKD